MVRFISGKISFHLASAVGERKPKCAGHSVLMRGFRVSTATTTKGSVEMRCAIRKSKAYGGINSIGGTDPRLIRWPKSAGSVLAMLLNYF